MRLKEIEERLAAIKNELTTRAAELKEEEITALENEVTALQEERAAIKAAAEKRSALLARIAAGESVGDGEGDGSGQQRVLRNFKGAAGEGDNDDKYGSMEYRKAFMKYVCRGEELPKEYRADAVSKSTDVGAVIPTTVLNQIVEKLESTGMILALVTRTAYKGGVSIPVSTVKPTATWVNEGAGSDEQKKNIAKDGMITFAYHKLRCAVAVYYCDEAAVGMKFVAGDVSGTVQGVTHIQTDEAAAAGEAGNDRTALTLSKAVKAGCKVIALERTDTVAGMTTDDIAALKGVLKQYE